MMSTTTKGGVLEVAQGADPSAGRLAMRADLYRLFSSAFCTPCDAWQQERVFQNLSDIMARLYPETTCLASELAATWDGAELSEVSVESARLFVGPFELAAPPYGSCYLEQGNRVMGDSTMQVASFYREWGLALAQDTKEVPDHIAIELEFMNFLAHRQAQVCAAGNSEDAAALQRAQQKFIRHWLLPFVSALAAQIVKATELSFFQLLAKTLDAFVLHEDESLAATVDSLDAS